MHSGVRESPKRVARIGDEMRSGDNFLLSEDFFATQGAGRLACDYEGHLLRHKTIGSASDEFASPPRLVFCGGHFVLGFYNPKRSLVNHAVPVEFMPALAGLLNGFFGVGVLHR